MSLSTLIQSAGFATLKATDGEPLTLVTATGNISLTAVVNRNLVTGKEFLRIQRDSAADFQVQGLTEIEVDKDQLVNAPEAGQYFTDSMSYRHRIIFVSQTDMSWKAMCRPSKVVVRSGVTMDSTLVTMDSDAVTMDQQ